MSDAVKKNVVFYRDRLLPLSETFIKEQGESLGRFTPYYLGARPSDGIALPPQQTMFIGGKGPVGRVQEVLFKGLHFAPGAMRKLRTLSPALVHAHFAGRGRGDADRRRSQRSSCSHIAWLRRHGKRRVL